MDTHPGRVEELAGGRGAGHLAAVTRVLQLGEDRGRALGQRVVRQLRPLGHHRGQARGRGLGLGRHRGLEHPCDLPHHHHLYLAAGSLEDTHGLVVIHIDTRDSVDGEELVIDPEAGLVRRATGRNSGDKHALVVILEGGGAQAAGDAETEALVRAAEGDLVHYRLHRDLRAGKLRLAEREEIKPITIELSLMN